MRLKSGVKRWRLKVGKLRSSSIVMRKFFLIHCFCLFGKKISMNFLENLPKNIKLQEFTAIAINFACARS
jgi:hypothetical protein